MADEIIKTVAVIGSGMSGLLVIHHLMQSKTKFSVTAFERNYDIGGLWLYTDQTTPDEFGLPVYSAMYNNLRTNLPTQLMTIPGFEFDEHVPNFPDRHDVLNYLQKFCDKNSLRKYIKFNTIVKKVMQVDPNNRQTRWIVSYSDIRKKDDTTSEEFDYVIVCNGNCFSPRIPAVKGSESFRGFISHSITYRRPDIFAGQTVALLGGSLSAQDISLQLKDYAEKVYICHKGPEIATQFPANIIQKISTFDHIRPKSVVLKSGEELIVDSIIYCTGYLYDYPFLPDGVVKIENDKIRNFYKEMIPDQYSSILFMATPRRVAFFPQADGQARFIRALLEGSGKLPDIDDMKQTIDDDFNNVGANLDNNFSAVVEHLTRTWNYNKELAEMGNFYPLPNILRHIHQCTLKNLLTDCSTFRNYVFKITGPDNFSVVYKESAEKTTNI